MTRYLKTFAAAVTTILMFVIFDGQDASEIEEAIHTIVVTFLVYLLPNYPPGQVVGRQVRPPT